MSPPQKTVLALGVNYVDILAAVEVMIEEWERANGRSVDDSDIRNLFCFWSLCIGGPPKSRSNMLKVTRAREQIIAGVYFSSAKRDEVRRRLKPAFRQAPDLGAIDLGTTDVESFVDLR